MLLVWGQILNTAAKLLTGLIPVIAVHACASDANPTAPQIRAAIERTLPLLQSAARSFRERSEGRCISCHHQGLVLQTVALARERGFAVDESLAREEVERVHGFYVRRQERYLTALADPAARVVAGVERRAAAWQLLRDIHGDGLFGARIGIPAPALAHDNNDDLRSHPGGRRDRCSPRV